VIILSLTAIVLVSLFFGSARGIAIDWVRARRGGKQRLEISCP
jgi:hypothetical protein